MSNEHQRQVFIQNIPYEISEDELSTWCQSFGQVAQCRLKCDKNGYSRGFAFVTFVTTESHERFLAKQPHYCKDRLLNVRDSLNSKPGPPTPPPVVQTQSQTEPQPIDFEYDENDLIEIREEFEADCEMLKIQHEQELKVLNEHIRKEKQRRDEAEELYRQAQEDLELAKKKNAQLRDSLIKNVMQTFNLRRDFGRKIKKENEILIDLQSNRT